MGKIGNYEYPDLSVGEAIRIAEILVKDFKGKVSDLNNFAKAIGHKTHNSGSFYIKLADMRKYGLMDKREVEATNLSEIIANPKDSSERQEAINKAVSNITLFERLKERLKTKNPSLEQFKTQLIEITQDRNKASNQAEKIRKIYIEAMSHTNENITEIKNIDDKQKGIKKVEEHLISLNSGDLNISLPKTTANIEVLITILQNLKKEKK